MKNRKKFIISMELSATCNMTRCKCPKKIFPFSRFNYISFYPTNGDNKNDLCRRIRKYILITLNTLFQQKLSVTFSWIIMGASGFHLRMFLCIGCFLFAPDQGWNFVRKVLNRNMTCRLVWVRLQVHFRQSRHIS